MSHSVKNIEDDHKALRQQPLDNINVAHLVVEQSLGLEGTVDLVGAKNAVLVIMASLILTEGKSTLYNVPSSADVHHMIIVLRELGAEVTFDETVHTLTVDTTFVRNFCVNAELMRKMRASILVMGPLLARFKRAEIALPGGCLIGPRPIDFHLRGFVKMGVEFSNSHHYLHASVSSFHSSHIVLEYPSVGATENILMAASITQGTTKIINASLEPEVLDLITVLKKMGAEICIEAPSTLVIQGVTSLKPVQHTIMMDRLEAGGLLLAAAITGGKIQLPHAHPQNLAVFLHKLEEMGHHIEYTFERPGITLSATKNPKGIVFRTAPYPGFPTDLQAPMMAALCLAEGKSFVHETVFENRLLHVRELQKMGAQISIEGDRATVTGVDQLYGAQVIATDIRASCALVLAGLAAKGITHVTGIHHWQRGYEALEKKLRTLGAKIALKTAC